MAKGADWRDDAACLHVDPDLFFPVGTIGPGLDQVDEAKRICQACPVQQRCLAWAVDLRTVSGIWGSTTDDERRDIRGRRPARKAAVPARQQLEGLAVSHPDQHVHQQLPKTAARAPASGRQRDLGRAAGPGQASAIIQAELRGDRGFGTPA